MQDKIASPSGRAAMLAADKRPARGEDPRAVSVGLFREPNDDELQIAAAHLAKHRKDIRPAYEDIVWALINTKEFLFNH